MTDTPHGRPVRSVLRHLDPTTLATAAKAESRARQRHLPPVSTYRWWARRTETISGALIDSVAADRAGRLLIADPFAGGGVIGLAALLRGHQVYVQDINPWAARSLHTMLTLPGPDLLDAAARRLREEVADLLGEAYATRLSAGDDGEIVHTLRVAVAACPSCAAEMRLFPTALVSLLSRVDCGGEEGYVACRAGHLHVASARKPSRCPTCDRTVDPTAKYTLNRAVACRLCDWSGKLSDLAQAGWTWEPVLIERLGDGVREISPPSREERLRATDSAWAPSRALPEIGPGPETSALLRHGMSHWHDLYPARQRVVLEALLDACTSAADGDASVEYALRAGVIGSAEMAGYASRWDARYLKSYESIANHRFNVTTLTVEPNVWGAGEAGRGTVSRRLTQIAKAATWLEEQVGRPLKVQGPHSSEARRSLLPKGVDARVVAGSSSRLTVPDGSVDAIVTDPPYHDDVHYAELSDLFRAWAGQATGALDGDAIVDRENSGPATEVYRKLLTDIFVEMRRVICADGHLVLSYANRYPGAWVALFRALADAGFQAVGYTVVHSENELDHAKSGRRACTLDVLLDLVPATDRRVRLYRPAEPPATPEEVYCHLVGEEALRIGKHRPEKWAEEFVAELRATPFLARKTPARATPSRGALPAGTR